MIVKTRLVVIDGREIEIPLSQFVSIENPDDWFLTRGVAREPHFMACDGVTRVVKKRIVKLEARERIINAGGVAMVSWQAPDPIKLWVNSRPVVGAQAGKSISPYFFCARYAGEYRVTVRDSRYRAEPLGVVVVE